MLAAALTFIPMSFDASAPTDSPAAVVAEPIADTADSATDLPKLLVVGDSLSAGYGLGGIDEGWVALLQKRLDERGYGIRVVNASISGDTTEGGAARLPAALRAHTPSFVIIELGGNDGLRGVPIEVTEANLNRMVTDSRNAGASVTLLGMRIPPNYGPRYTEQFEATFRQVAEAADVPMEPFFLADVALDPTLMQADGIHPNAAAQSAMLERAWPAIERSLATTDFSESTDD